mmetsp:Transcript_55587/g.147810  ORF Transcript_55587/g.147810 Transcript_55587/m.147810 type:complete len:225 (-) Transcript_55587:293-967(-)
MRSWWRRFYTRARGNGVLTLKDLDLPGTIKVLRHGRPEHRTGERVPDDDTALPRHVHQRVHRHREQGTPARLLPEGPLVGVHTQGAVRRDVRLAVRAAAPVALDLHGQRPACLQASRARRHRPVPGGGHGPVGAGAGHGRLLPLRPFRAEAGGGGRVHSALLRGAGERRRVRSPLLEHPHRTEDASDRQETHGDHHGPHHPAHASASLGYLGELTRGVGDHRLC